MEPLFVNHHSHPKPLTTTTTTFHNNSNNNLPFSYEPTSVLDVRRSPSPVIGGTDSGTGFNDTPFQWEWDSLVLGLEEDDEKDNSTHPFTIPSDFIPSYEPHIPIPNLPPSDPPSTISSFLPNSDSNSNPEFDCTQLNQLIRAATCVESNDLRLADVLLARLNLRSPTGKPLQRSSFYFKEALQHLLSGSLNSYLRLSKSEIFSKIFAYKSFTDISPINMFSSFTSNQIVSESLNGALYIHIIDFEIGLGCQWASLMQSLVTKSTNSTSLQSLRITAVIPEESSIEASLISHNLQLFAQQLRIQFKVDFIYYSSFEMLSFNAMEFIPREVIAVNLSPSILRQLRTIDAMNGFLRFLRRISPKITMFVDSESCRDIRDGSFKKNFVNGIEFYSILLESLDAAGSSYGDMIGRIEKFVIRPKIAATLSAAAANCILPWREMLSGAGMVPVQFSEFADCQAQWLVRRTQLKGFHVVKRPGVLSLCWQDRELVAMSAWKC